MIIGIGVDLVEVARMAQILERTPTFATRCFTNVERADAGNGAGRAASLAARFAAKEAVMKAMGVGLGAFGFYDVEVVKAPSGAPSLVLRGPAAELAAERGITSWHLSLSHSESSAIAMVVAESGQTRP
jgi:holo-[acyl-carrier protein] synthase